MNKIARFIVIVVLISSLAVTFSCKKDEPFYHISAYEELLHQNVNSYRVSQGKSELVLQPVMVIESQANSANWKSSGDATSGIDARFVTIKEKIGGTNDGYITYGPTGDQPDDVINSWKSDPAKREILLGEWTQSGPGIVTGDANMVYITYLFLFIPD